jgi:hypothetical protein
MRLLRIFGIAVLLTVLLLGVAFFWYRSIARKQQHDVGASADGPYTNESFHSR